MTAGASGKARIKRSVGKFLLIRPIGRGSMGVVYKALDRQTYKVVALKTTQQGDLASVAGGAEQLHSQLMREARVIQSLKHPNIVYFYEAGACGDLCYFAMEFVRGSTLLHLLRTRGFPSARAACFIAIQVLRGLCYAHSKRIVHRDIKPSNLIINQERQVKITDFGIAKILSEATSTHYFQTGDMVGTPCYMSPEQIMAERVDHRSDIFSVGCVLFEMLTGFKPFDGETVAMMLNATVSRDPRPPSEINAALPPELDPIVLRALSKQPADRFATADEMADALATLLRTMGKSRTQWIPAPTPANDVGTDQHTPLAPVAEDRGDDDDLTIRENASGGYAAPPGRAGADDRTRATPPQSGASRAPALSDPATEPPPRQASRPSRPEPTAAAEMAAAALHHKQQAMEYLRRKRYLAAIVSLRKYLLFNLDDAEARDLLQRAEAAHRSVRTATS